MKRNLLIPILLLTLVLSACAAPAPKADTDKPYVAVTFGYADGLRYSPSFAIWIEDEEGNAATLYATAKAAANNWGGQPRDSVLPVWNGAREGADVVSGATPQKGASLTLNVPEAFWNKKLTLYIEANASFDYNDYYAEGLSEGDAGYSDVNGQPSAVWKAVIGPEASGAVSPVIAGAGEVMGKDYELHDAANLTTAAGLLIDIGVKWEPGK
jgi:hypothetical protein